MKRLLLSTVGVTSCKPYYLIVFLLFSSGYSYGAEKNILSIFVPGQETLVNRFEAIGALDFARESGLLRYVDCEKIEVMLTYQFMVTGMDRAVTAMQKKCNKECADSLRAALDCKKNHIVEAIFKDTTQALLLLQKTGHYKPTGNVVLPDQTVAGEPT